jgi:uncharacterized protein with PIN domain
MSEEIYQCEARLFQTDQSTGKRGLTWVKLQVLRAMQMGDRPETRCPECHGPVRLHKAGPHGVPAAHAEHMRKHSGCSLGFCFEGIRSLHPDAIE